MVLALGLWLTVVGLALFRLSRHFDGRLLLAGLVGIWIATAWLNWRDKRSAEAGEWRISEQTLHLLELLGGWPVAGITQRWIRHKVSKGRYQVVFWLIGILQIAVAADFLANWMIVAWVSRWATGN